MVSGGLRAAGSCGERGVVAELLVAVVSGGLRAAGSCGERGVVSCW